ncbi:MAG: bifunctional glutamate N-acetyltransferase/amino-acid acetyltransferase ArgJ [Dehalococcoidales bacterium]|nr:bifunctional glutamate N-acetyltransferase/amino-acid acetyltransferase ArgJ [Dehalococcoidales bacterium]
MSTQFEIISDGGVTTPEGFSAGATFAGIKKQSKDVLDLSLLYSEVPCVSTGIFTRNLIKAAPVLLDQEKLAGNGKMRAILVNSGCANACTGKQGMESAIACAGLAAARLGITSAEVLVASTGVIGVQLPMDKIREGIGRIVLSHGGGSDLSKAIMTTDTRPKKIAVRVSDGKSVFTIGGTAKGAGMIHPDMATLLAFITTDASVEAGFLAEALTLSADSTFNMLTVDGDTSTNDSLIIMANGLAGNETIKAGSKLAAVFNQALDEVCQFLAKSIARDGEGATRLIEVLVTGAVSLDDARKAARTIAGSPLVKTAVHGCDPNWGRIIAAAGRSGAKIVQDRTDVYIGRTCLFKAGTPLAFDKKSASVEMGRDEVLLRLDLNLGEDSARAWGCDLTGEYVVINSDYTT